MDTQPPITHRAPRRHRRLMLSIGCTVAVASFAVGCGSVAKRGADVASLGTDAPRTSTDGTTDGTGGSTPTSSSIDPKDALLEYTKCMRDEGVDMPDPQVVKASSGASSGPVTGSSKSGSGNGPSIAIAGAGGVVAIPADVGSDTFKAASEKCQPILAAAQSQIKIDPKVEAEQRRKMLEFSKCMRAHGVDMPDPVFGDNGSMSVTIGSGDGTSSGPDPQSDKFQVASKACGNDGGGIALAAPVTTS